MSIKLKNYTFEGPYFSTTVLEDKSGIYAILDGQNSVVDIGESSEVRTRVENHDRKVCWNRQTNSSWKVAVLYTPHLQQPGRMVIEQELRDFYNPPCGKR